jgi:hypothetical protein
MLTCDYYHQVDGVKNKTEEYWNIVNKIWSKLCEKYVNSTTSLEKCFKNMEEFEKFMYDVIYGDVQSGKSLAIMLLGWYSWYKMIDIVPIIITKVRTVVADDFSNKASDNGKVNKVIKSVINECYGKRGETFKNDVYEFFKLKAYVREDIRKSLPVLKMGDILILLMNHAHFKDCVRYFNMNCVQNKRTLIMIDEVHEMYTVHHKNRKTGLTKEQLSGLKNQKMMYWLYEEWKQKKIYLVGISATLGRAIVDRDIHPTTVYKLTSDVESGNKYRSLDKIQRKILSDSDFKPETIVETLKEIKSIPHFTYNGKKYIKCVLINTEYLNDGQEQLKKRLEKECEMIVRVINQTNESIHETFENLKSSDYSKLVNGGLVLIGCKMFEAAVSVKPSVGTDVKFDYKGESYELFGLTDMIFKSSKNLENNIQRMRLFGIYPGRYILRLWSTEETFELLKEQMRVNKELVERYDKGPKSIESYMTSIKFDLFGDTPYKNKSWTLKWREQMEEVEGIKLNTRIYKKVLTEEQIKEFNGNGFYKISDFFKKTIERNKLKNMIKSNLKIELKDFQLPYSEKRYVELMRDIVRNEQKNEWRIQNMFTGKQGHNSKLEDCYVIQFDPVEKRPVYNEKQNYYYNVGDGYVVYHKKENNNEYTHQYLDDEVEYNDNHMDSIDNLVNEYKPTENKRKSKPVLKVKK